MLSIEALSHYLDYQRFLAEAHRVLRRGGKLLVVDGNNGLNPSTRRYCNRIWALHERDIVNGGSRSLASVPKRQRIIHERFPELDVSEAHTLALRTAGMVRDEIHEAVHTYLDSGKLPPRRLRARPTLRPSRTRDGDGAPVQPILSRTGNPFARLRGAAPGLLGRGEWPANGAHGESSARGYLTSRYADRSLVPDCRHKALSHLAKPSPRRERNLSSEAPPKTPARFAGDPLTAGCANGRARPRS